MAVSIDGGLDGVYRPLPIPEKKFIRSVQQALSPYPKPGDHLIREKPLT